MQTVPMTVVETPFFLRKAIGLLSDMERGELVTFIASTPDIGDVIPDTGGVRKLRWAAKGKGADLWERHYEEESCAEETTE